MRFEPTKEWRISAVFWTSLKGCLHPFCTFQIFPSIEISTRDSNQINGLPQLSTSYVCRKLDVWCDIITTLLPKAAESLDLGEHF